MFAITFKEKQKACEKSTDKTVVCIGTMKLFSVGDVSLR